VCIRKRIYKKDMVGKWVLKKTVLVGLEIAYVQASVSSEILKNLLGRKFFVDWEACASRLPELDPRNLG